MNPHVKGRRRVDFLADSSDAAHQDVDAPAGKESDDADGEFVEVLEWVNFRDSIKGRGGATYKGRFEVYVLGQPGKEYQGPVSEGPLPFADADGVGLSPVEALIFESEPHYPLRGVAPAERVLPQVREYNVLRTKLAELVRRNARKGFRRKGAISDDQVDKLFDGNDGVAVEVEDPEVALNAVWFPLPNQPVPAEIWNWIGMVDADQAAAWGQIAPAQGTATDKGKTAYANQIEQFWTETEVGYHGNVLATFSRRVVRLLLRATVHAMGTVGDAGGGVADLSTGAVRADLALAPVGSVETGGEAAVTPPEEGGPGAAVEAVDAGAVAVAEGDADAVAGVEVQASPVAAPVVKVEYVEFTVRDADRRLHRVTRESLDADFDVKFLEGARTPLADAAVTQFLATQSQVYFGWFDLVMKGGPMGILARAWMQAVADRMQLPPELHVATLDAKARKQAEKEAPPPAPAEEEPPPAEEESPASPAGGGEEGAAQVDAIVFALQGVVDGLAALSSLDQAAVAAATRMVGAAIEAARAGDAEGVVQAVSAAMEALAPVAGKVQPGTPEEGALREVATVLVGIVKPPGGADAPAVVE
jgi:hypothetical protein